MSFLFQDVERFRVILADCPWRYDNFGQAKHGAARAHYDTMTFDELAALPVERMWAADDAFLLMWATWPKLEEAMRLVARWGFTYCTGWPWVKTTPSAGEIRCGIGFWVQSTSEMVLLARRGALAREEDAPHVRGLLVGEQPRVFYAPIGKHSAKPLELHAWIEETLPGPRLELFARKERAGWTCYGLELGQRLTARGAETVCIECQGTGQVDDPGAPDDPERSVDCPGCKGTRKQIA